MSLSEFLGAVLVLFPAPQEAPHHYTELQHGMPRGESALFLRRRTFVSVLVRSVKMSRGWKWYRTPFKLPPTPRSTGEKLRRTRWYDVIWMKRIEPLHTWSATAWTGPDCRIVCFEKSYKNCWTPNISFTMLTIFMGYGFSISQFTENSPLIGLFMLCTIIKWGDDQRTQQDYIARILYMP